MKLMLKKELLYERYNKPRHPRIYHIVLEAFLRLTLTNKQEELFFEPI